jgi:hypothetical protein
MNLVLKLDTGLVLPQFTYNMMTSLSQSGPLLEMNVPFHSGNTFLDSLIDKQGNESNLLRELKICLTPLLPFQSMNPILKKQILNNEWIQTNSVLSMRTLIHKTVPTYLKRLKKALLKSIQQKQVVLPTNRNLST